MPTIQTTKMTQWSEKRWVHFYYPDFVSLYFSLDILTIETQIWEKMASVLYNSQYLNIW